MLFICLWSLSSCRNKNAPVQSKDEFNLVFFATTDVHGSLFPYDFLKKENTDHSLAQVATLLRALRENPQNEVLYVDLGDYFQGQPVIYYYNFMHKGKNVGAEVLNYLQPAAAAVGNHDIETGPQIYNKLVKQMRFPYLAANVLRTDNQQPYFQPYAVKNIHGFKVAFIGMVETAIPHQLPEGLWKDMYFEDIAESSKKWIAVIKEKEQPDLIVGLFHSGLGREDEGPMAEDKALYTATHVDGYDIIFKGHDHLIHLVHAKSPSGRPVVVLGGNNAVQSAAQVQVNVKKVDNAWQLGPYQAQIIDIAGKNIPADPQFMRHFDKDFKMAKKELESPVARMAETVTSRDSIFGPSAFVDLVHDLQFKVARDTLKVPADISFAAPLAKNATLHQGDVLFSDLFSLYAYENWLYVMRLSGQEIKDFLEYSYGRWTNQMRSDNDYMILYQLDGTGKPKKDEHTQAVQTLEYFFNYDCAAGINYTVDLSKPRGQKIVITGMSDGSDFDLTKTYQVAVNSYRGSGGGGHLTRGAGIPKDQLNSRIIAATDKDLRFYLGDVLKRAGTVNPPFYGNWYFIPKEWAEKARQREYPIWFPSE